MRPQRPVWMNEETYERMPETLTVREVEVQVDRPGFRTESMVVVTSLTDERAYTLVLRIVRRLLSVAENAVWMVYATPVLGVGVVPLK